MSEQQEIEDDTQGECSVKVMCRVRPLNQSEEKAGSKFVLKFPSETSIAISVSIVHVGCMCISVIIMYHHLFD